MVTESLPLAAEAPPAVRRRKIRLASISVLSEPSFSKRRRLRFMSSVFTSKHVLAKQQQKQTVATSSLEALKPLLLIHAPSAKMHEEAPSAEAEDRSAKGPAGAPSAPGPAPEPAPDVYSSLSPAQVNKDYDNEYTETDDVAGDSDAGSNNNNDIIAPNYNEDNDTVAEDNEGSKCYRKSEGSDDDDDDEEEEEDVHHSNQNDSHEKEKEKRNESCQEEEIHADRRQEQNEALSTEDFLQAPSAKAADYLLLSSAQVKRKYDDYIDFVSSFNLDAVAGVTIGSSNNNDTIAASPSFFQLLHGDCTLTADESKRSNDYKDDDKNDEESNYTNSEEDIDENADDHYYVDDDDPCGNHNDNHDQEYKKQNERWEDEDDDDNIALNSDGKSNWTRDNQCDENEEKEGEGEKDYNTKNDCGNKHEDDDNETTKDNKSHEITKSQSTYRQNQPMISAKREQQRKSFNQQWYEKYWQLVRYKETTGHCNVSQKNGGSLGEWVTNQRRNFKRGVLCAYRVAALDQLEFQFEPFGPHEKHWQRMFHELKEFLRKTGRYPRRIKGDYERLSRWITVQRVAYKRGRLAPNRIQALESINFCWNLDQPVKDKWAFMYLQLKEYQQKNRTL